MGVCQDNEEIRVADFKKTSMALPRGQVMRLTKE
jgi:hypothetical protein